MRFNETISKCIDDDIRSKELLYKTFYGYIKGVILRYTFNSDDIEELVNDSFMKVFQHLKTFMPETTEDTTLKLFKGWIGKIASRTAIDHLRKNNKFQFVDKFNEREAAYIPQEVYNTLEVNDILSLLGKLPHLHSTVFNLYEIEGFSHREIASQLNITASSSRVFLTRAKNKLKKLYVQQQLIKKEIE